MAGFLNVGTINKIDILWFNLKPLTGQPLAERWMTSPFWHAALLLMTCFLVSCGGGGSANPNATTLVTCDSQTLWAALPSPNGTAIPDQNIEGISVTFDNQNCALQSMRSASVEICLAHTRPADLQWTITSPGAASPLSLTVPDNWNASGTSCDSDRGRMQRIELVPPLASTILKA